MYLFDILIEMFHSSLFSTYFLAYRKTVKILFPKEAVERQHTQELSPDYTSLLAKFESLNSKRPRHPSTNGQFVQHQHLGFSLFKAVFTVLSILGIIMVR